MARIYLASSWRNEQQPAVLRALREAGHQVYDFRNPTPGNHGFSWRQITPEERPWSAARTREVLSHPIAEEGFGLDFRAMQWADTCVMLQPCGRSAALELGWAAGAGKRTLVLLADGQEPELMLKVADRLCLSIAEVLEDLSTPRPSARGRTFHAEVALMGHKDLGLCRVEETSLAGADLLRCTQLTVEPERVHWIRAASIYDLEEVSEQHARELVEQAREQAAKERVAREERARREAEAAAKLRAERAGAKVRVFVAGPHVQVHALRVEGLQEVYAPGLLTYRDLREALLHAGLDVNDLWNAHAAEGPRAGYTVPHAADDVEIVLRAVRGLGFAELERAADVPDEQAEEGL